MRATLEVLTSLTMSSFNSKQIDQILSENDGFLRAIQEFQSVGKISEVIE
jgi:hypothetical protein